MTQLETSVACMMKVFDTYAGKEGKPDSLTKAEVKALLENELPGLLKVLLTPGEARTCWAMYMSALGTVVISAQQGSGT